MELLDQSVRSLQQLNQEMYHAIRATLEAPWWMWAVYLLVAIAFLAVVGYGFRRAPAATGTLVTLASFVLAAFCLVMMLVIDVRTLAPLATDIRNPNLPKPDPILGNHYSGYLGGLFIAIGTAIQGYKWTFGFDHILKPGGRYHKGG